MEIVNIHENALLIFLSNQVFRNAQKQLVDLKSSETGDQQQKPFPEP